MAERTNTLRVGSTYAETHNKSFDSHGDVVQTLRWCEMRFGLVYSIESPTQDWVGAYDNVLEQVLLAEKHGYNSVLVSEHHLVETGYFPSVMVASAGLATRTSKIRIGTGVILLPLHHPLEVAEDTAVLDVISKGRAILGVGYGYRPEEYSAFGVPLEERVSRFDEEVTIVEKLLREPSVTFHGKYFKLNNVTVMPRPVQKPRPPVWVAAKRELAVKKTARQGDAWFPDPVSALSVLKERVRVYREELKKVGKRLEEIEFPLMKEGYIASDTDTAWKDCREYVLNNYRDYLKWGHMQDDEGRPVDPSDESALATLERRFIIGSPDDCIERIERHIKELGVNHMLFRIQFCGLPHKKSMNAIKLFAEKVFPQFKEEH